MDFMKARFNKILSLFLCLIMICSMGLVSIAYAVDDVSDYQAMNFGGEAPADFCKIKRTTATVTINTFEKVKLYADYSVYSDENYELVWSIDGKSYFLNGAKDKTTTGTDVKMRFLDDTTVKLQIVSSNGDVLCEDEIFLKSYRDKDRSFFVNLQANFLLAIMIFIGVIGGTIGPWIGSLM